MGAPSLLSLLNCHIQHLKLAREARTKAEIRTRTGNVLQKDEAHV